MKILRTHFSFLIIWFTSCFLLTTCSNRSETINCFPDSNIDVVIQLNLPAYLPLQNVGGWVYINEQNCGTRGLIVVKTNNGFYAYDRNAPHICPSTDTTLKVENNIKIVCPNDESEWILITGEPIKTATIAPRKYYVYHDQNSQTLTITN